MSLPPVTPPPVSDGIVQPPHSTATNDAPEPCPCLGEVEEKEDDEEAETVEAGGCLAGSFSTRLFMTVWLGIVVTAVHGHYHLAALRGERDLLMRNVDGNSAP